MLEELKKYQEMANFLKIFGDENRLKILFLIDKEPHTVTDLTNKLGLSKSAISHQLRILKDNRIVAQKKVGKNIYFSLNDWHVTSILNITNEHIMEK